MPEGKDMQTYCIVMGTKIINETQTTDQLHKKENQISHSTQPQQILIVLLGCYALLPQAQGFFFYSFFTGGGYGSGDAVIDADLLLPGF